MYGKECTVIKTANVKISEETRQPYLYQKQNSVDKVKSKGFFKNDFASLKELILRKKKMCATVRYAFCDDSHLVYVSSDIIVLHNAYPALKKEKNAKLCTGVRTWSNFPFVTNH